MKAISNGLFLFLALSLFALPLFAQEKKFRSTQIGIRTHNGFIVPHSKKIKHLTESHPWGFEIDYNLQLMKEDIWQYCFCYPKTGFSVFYTNFAFKEVLGSTVSAYAFIEPVIGAGQKISFSSRFGIGPSYMTNVFDSVANPENKFFSTAFSFIVLLNFNLWYRFNERWSANISASYNHISNGGIKNPNLGMNYPTFGIGLLYNLSPKPYLYLEKDKSTRLIHYKNRFDLSVNHGAKTARKGEEKYYIPGIIASYARAYGRINGFSVSAEFVLDFAEKEVIRKDQIMKDSALVDPNYASVMVANEFLLGRFIFYQQLGYYIYSPYIREDDLYQRYGISFYFTERWFADLNLKVHRHEADFLALRIGYSIFK